MKPAFVTDGDFHGGFDWREPVHGGGRIAVAMAKVVEGMHDHAFRPTTLDADADFVVGRSKSQAACPNQAHEVGDSTLNGGGIELPRGVEGVVIARPPTSEDRGVD